MSLGKKCFAEFFGTFWLVFGGCGSAIFAVKFGSKLSEGAGDVNIGIGLVGVSLAFGLTVLTMAYAIGHISGCHLNPAVSAGMVSAGRMSLLEFFPYVIAQVAGGLAAAFLLYFIESGAPNYVMKTGPGAFATNGYGDLSPGSYSQISCLTAEVVLTFMFLFIILGATDAKAPPGFAPIAIGLGLTLIHLIGIPITNLSVNPARSTGPAVVVAVYSGDRGPLMQLGLFWGAPIAGALLAGIVYQVFFASPKKS